MRDLRHIWGMNARGEGKWMYHTLQVAAVGSEDINGPVHDLRENRTVLDVASFDNSFELRDWFAPGAMEGNVC